MAEAVEAPQTIAYNFNRKTTELPLAAVSDIAAALGMEPNALVAQLQKGGNYDAMYSVMERQKPFSSILDRLRQVGALGDLPESSQVSFF